jgi:hypothetical protein
MHQVHLRKLAIAGSTVVCAALLSLSWSEQRGVSLSVESAQAQAVISNPAACESEFASANCENIGAGSPFDPRATGNYYPRTALGANAYYAAPTVSPGWYIGPYGGMACTSGTIIASGKGLPFRCP